MEETEQKEVVLEELKIIISCLSDKEIKECDKDIKEFEKTGDIKHIGIIRPYKEINSFSSGDKLFFDLKDIKEIVEQEIENRK